MKKLSFWQLYWIFVKIGAISLGGGYVILPIITNELCEKQKLIDENDVLDYFALSQSLPGIIAANISMFTGYKLKGKRGAILAMFGVITAPFICIALLASIIGTMTENIYIKGAFWGIGIAVIAIITLTIRELWRKSKQDTFFYGIFFTALLALFLFNLSPIKVILIFSAIGIITKYLINKEKNE